LASWGDDAIRIWRLDSCDAVAMILQGITYVGFQSLEFHPTEPILAAITDGGHSISLWHLDVPTLLRASRPSDAVRYANAKVVLVGDTGVGKSGLAIRLKDDRFEQTESTHARRAMVLEAGTVDDPVVPGRRIARETLLWDLAGQPGYRLVHQLSLDDAAVALVLFDARSETDPFGGAAYWSKALSQARSNVPIRKFLVAARVDRGGVGVSRERIDRFLQEHGFEGFYRTSALTGDGRTELLDAIRLAISWERLPIVSSNRLLSNLRDFVRQRRADPNQPLLVTAGELWRQGQQSSVLDDLPDADAGRTFEQFAACLRRLHEADVIELLSYQTADQNPSPDIDVLLEPTYIDAYASAVILAARDEPDGLGHLPEAEILNGRFPLEVAERLADEEAERKVLVTVIERFLDREIAFRERIEGVDYLVFPSQYTREAPFPGSTSYGIRYDFAGPLLSIFATLAVRLAHHTGFRGRQFYRFAAAYEPADGGRCAILFEDLEEGRGRLSVFFEDGVSIETQGVFLEYVYEHLMRKAVPGSIVRRRAYHCPKCGYLFDDQVVETRLARGDDQIVCSSCDTRSPLYDLLLEPSDRDREAIARIDADARAAMHRQLAVTAIQGKKRSGAFDFLLAYAPEDRDEALWLAELFQALGLRPWLDVWQTVPGQAWQQALHPSLSRIRAVLIALGSPDELPWQDDAQAKILAAFHEREARFATVRLPQSGLAESVHEASVQEAPTRVVATAPESLREQTPFDLRWIDEDDFEPLDECLRQLLGRYSLDFGASEPVRDALRRKQLDEQRRRRFADAHPDSSSLIRFHPKLKPQQFGRNDAESLRCQIAEVIGMPSQFVTVHNAQSSPPRVTLRFALPEDVQRLLAMVSADDPFMREVFERWAIDRAEFQQTDQDAAERVKGLLASQRTESGDPRTGTKSRRGREAEPRPVLQILGVQLKNFRCFRELSLDLDLPSVLGGYWTCLAGINGSGKSSILQAICIGLLSQSAVHELGGGLLERLRRLEDGRPQDLEVTLRCRDRHGNEFDEWIVIQQDGVRSGRRVGRVRNQQTINRSALVLSFGATRNLSEAMDTRHTDKSDEAQRQMTLFDPLARVCSAESLLATTDKNAGFVGLFTRLCGEIFDGHFRVMSRDGGVRFSVEDETLDAIDLPDGFRSSVAWIADLCQAWCRRYPERAHESSPADIEAIVLIDEIDLHLHMSLQRKLVPALRKALPRVQWVVSTHSPLILTSFDRNEIVALDRDEPAGVRHLDRQILGWTTDEVIKWLMDTPTTSLVMEEKLRQAERAGGDQTDLAILLETSANVDQADARRRVAALKERLEKFKP
jgi:GTPase SAR1 family protein